MPPPLTVPPPSTAALPRVRLQGIEALRGVAATAVVLYHCARHLNQARPAPRLVQLFQFGHAGVDLFFVLSGFIILFVHAGDVGRPHRLRHYVARRVSRVFPTYWVALGLTVLAASAHGYPPLKDAAIALTLIPSDRAPLLGVAWTLQYEIVFYAVFASLIVHRRCGLALLGIWLVLVGVAACGQLTSDLLPASVLSAYNLEFAFGMFVALFLRATRLAHPWPVGAVAIGILALAALAEDGGAMNGYGDVARLAYGLPAALLIAAVAEADRSGCLRIPRWLGALGSASYSIYLFQFLLIGAVWRVWMKSGLAAHRPALADFALLVAAALGGGVVVSRLVEMRLLRERRNARARLADQCLAPRSPRH